MDKDDPPTSGFQNPIFRIMGTGIQKENLENSFDPKMNIQNEIGNQSEIVPNNMNMNNPMIMLIPEQIYQNNMNNLMMNQIGNQGQMNQNNMNNLMMNQIGNQGQMNQYNMNNLMMNQIGNQGQMNQYNMNNPMMNQIGNQGQINQNNMNNLMMNQIGNQGQMNQYNMNNPMINQSFMNKGQINMNQMNMQRPILSEQHNINSMLIFMQNRMLADIYYFIDYKIKSKKFSNQTISNKNDKIFIDYYGNIFEMGINLRLYVSKMINYIFDEIFGEIHEKLIWERTDKSQTTKDVILNPKIEYLKIRENDYSNYLYLEYKNENLLDSKDIPCKDLLKNGDLIFLKFKKEELKKFEKDGKNNMQNNINQNLNQLDNKIKESIGFIINKEIRAIIQISKNELISTLIDIFLEKIGEPLEIKNKLIFLYNDSLINMNKTVGNFFISSINPKIIVNDPNNLIGTENKHTIRFVDMTSEKKKNI